MRNLLLSLMLANLLFLAWHVWVDPSPPGVPVAPGGNPSASGLDLYGRAADPAPPVLAAPEDADAPAGGSPVEAPGPAAGNCFRVGPLPSATAVQQAEVSLVSRGIDAVPIARDAQLWLGHWVQIPGFSSVAVAEAARQRLVARGISDAYLMQDGPQPMLSLGVFRERSGADQVAAAARELGFTVSMRDRYRPTVEQWLLVRLRPGQSLAPEALSLADGRILRAEPLPCDDQALGPGEPVADAPLPSLPDQTL